MDTLQELINYCKEPEPVGALLLTGEWGCGKTYLVEQSLKEELKNSHIFVRISLFGINSVEIFHERVKQQWILSCEKFWRIFEFNKKTTDQGINLIEKGTTMLLPDSLKSIPQTLLSINVSDFISIKNKIGKGSKEKFVILVFDDLERSKLSSTELLGCINEYCENQKFHVIVIANEDRIVNKTPVSRDANKTTDITDNNLLSYSEIKEKVISRTIHYDPDYPKIIESIITNRNWGSEEYNQYLKDKKSLIQNLFHTENYENDYFNSERKPNNLRILKSAIQDFGRIFIRFKQSGVVRIDKYFIAFIVYSLIYKNGYLKVEPGKEFEFERKIINNYPGFNPFFLLNSCRKWIRDGDWNEDLFEYELQSVMEKDKDNDPEYIIRNFSILILEDEMLAKLFSGLLDDCYSGNLTLHRYIVFLNNAVILRECESPLYYEINWDLVRKGVEKRFKTDIEENENNNLYTHFIHDSEDQEKYINNEIEIYNLIKLFYTSNQVLYDNSEKQFLDDIKRYDFFSIVRSNYSYDRFTEDMEQAICSNYMNCSQEEKCSFYRYFIRFWQMINLNREDRKKEAFSNLQKMSEFLINLQSNYSENGKYIAARHTTNLLNAIEDILSELQNGNNNLISTN